ncbi:xanthine dehydrogenase family protein molybdopterin-binding subunit [Iodidimonas gelatinilytica]|nr:xanthine dehydrogenase family protein molybdopterin-binding subunit [Iodidimonas gelatinilytica]
MRKFGIGQSMRRVEDQRFLTGKGCYTDDLRFEGQLHAAFLRAPLAHGKILSINTDEASALDGVRLVLTHKDITAANIPKVPCLAPLPGIKQKDRPILAEDFVRYVGEPVAMVVADSFAVAREAVDLIEVDYDPLDAVADCAKAIEADAPQLFEEVPENRSFEWQTGDEAAVDAAFKTAAHISCITIRNNRVAPTSMEPRAINARYDADTGLEVHLGTQGVAGLLDGFSKLLGMDAQKIRVLTPDVGGGFGMKAFMFSEYVAVLLAARTLSQPVKWTCDRSEAFLSDTHGRDLLSTAHMAFDAHGHILGYRIETLANMGAYLSNFAPAIATMAPMQVVPGPYRIPVLHQKVTGVYTNTAPIDAYRGAGRPEAAYLLERLIHQGAQDLGLTQDEIRRRNFISSKEMPYKNATGAVYDSGDFARNMADAMARAEWDDFPKRRKASQERGLLRGIGMAYYVECTLGDPKEEIDVRFTDTGRVTISVGTQSNGQGHETAYAQVFGDKLGIDPHLIDIKQGDTADKNTGGGTGGSRSLQMIGNACVAASDAVIERGRELMAHMFDAALDDIRFDAGFFELSGTNRRLSVLDLAADVAKADKENWPQTLQRGLDLSASYTKPASTFPNGCHICEVELDPQTGVVRVDRYSVVDDFGVVINPMLVEGQVQGGVVQGIGQALGEDVVYDETAQLLSGSFMDYAMPKAGDMPNIDFSYNEIPCKTNPLGLKAAAKREPLALARPP